MSSSKDRKSQKVTYATFMGTEDFLRDFWPALWTSMEDGVNVNDDHGRYVFVSPSYCRLVGYSEKELIGKSFLEVVLPEFRDLYKKKYAEAVANEESGNIGEFQLVRKDGQLIDVEARYSIVRAFGRMFHAFIVRDITERKAIEKQLMHVDRIRALGTLAGGVAHEFNNLMVSILGYGEMIEKRAGQNTDDVGKYARKIQKAAKRGTTITSQLLPFARRDQFGKVLVNLNDVLKDVVDLSKLSIGKEIKIEKNLKASFPHILANAILLHQAFFNIFLNAKDAMPTGGILLVETQDCKDVSNEFKTTSQFVEIRITDNGCGMSEEVKSHIFEPFFTTKEPGKGTGLGLSLAFSAVEMHGGRMAVESKEGKGTTIFVWLPRIEKESGITDE